MALGDNNLISLATDSTAMADAARDAIRYASSHPEGIIFGALAFLVADSRQTAAAFKAERDAGLAEITALKAQVDEALAREAEIAPQVIELRNKKQLLETRVAEIEKLKEELAIKKNENQEAAAAAASELAAVEGNLKRYSEEKVNVARKRVEEASSEAAIKANNLLNVQIENADVKYALKEFLVKEGYITPSDVKDYYMKGIAETLAKYHNQGSNHLTEAQKKKVLASFEEVSARASLSMREIAAAEAKIEEISRSIATMRSTEGQQLAGEAKDVIADLEQQLKSYDQQIASLNKDGALAASSSSATEEQLYLQQLTKENDELAKRLSRSGAKLEEIKAQIDSKIKSAETISQSFSEKLMEKTGGGLAVSIDRARDAVVITHGGSAGVISLAGLKLGSVASKDTFVFPHGVSLSTGATVVVYCSPGKTGAPKDGLKWLTQKGAERKAKFLTAKIESIFIGDETFDV